MDITIENHTLRDDGMVLRDGAEVGRVSDLLAGLSKPTKRTEVTPQQALRTLRELAARVREYSTGVDVDGVSSKVTITDVDAAFAALQSELLELAHDPGCAVVTTNDVAVAAQVSTLLSAKLAADLEALRTTLAAAHAEELRALREAHAEESAELQGQLDALKASPVNDDAAIDAEARAILAAKQREKKVLARVAALALEKPA